jgi:hypothetical protein
MDQGGKQRPISGGEPNRRAVQLPLEDRDLVPQDKDLRILVPVTHRKQP